MKSWPLSNLILITALVVAAGLGFRFADDPFRLAGIGNPVDQEALDHRDSPYSHITWVISEANNYAELRFFDKVEGGVCLSPSWADMAALGRDGSLDHVAMPADADLNGAPAGSTWPAGRPKPNPGTLPKSPYVSIFPAGILLNDRLMTEANDDPRQAKPNILVVGLGSGVGISVLAHHFPEASIAVVDIDRVVIDMVVDHYPFIAWLRQQQTSDGRPRLKMGADEAIDARQYIRHQSLRNDDGRQYDLVIIDAFTDGSTIPPHLMTREFYEEVAAIMPPDGIVLSNVIGSYTGTKRKVVGGSILAQRAAGLEHAFNIPLMYNNTSFEPQTSRNNIILTSAQPLDPQSRSAAWQRLNAWVPYPELPTRRFVSRTVALARPGSQGLLGESGAYLSAIAPIATGDDYEDLRSQLRRLLGGQVGSDQPQAVASSDSASLIEQTRAMVLARYPKAPGWNDVLPSNARVYYQETDWVQYARMIWLGAIREARRIEMPGRIMIHRGQHLVGEDGRGGLIDRVPLFSDARPNADLFNR